MSDSPMSGGPMSGAPTASPVETQPLQEALSAEHAAVFAYGVVGGVLGGDHDLATAGHDAHRGRRDHLLSRLGERAVPAEPAYSLPIPVDRPQQARRLARLVERRSAAVYAEVVSRTSGAERALAAEVLIECAVRALSWGAAPEPFPGLDLP